MNLTPGLSTRTVLDLRSLAAFRICLGALVVADVLTRARFLVDHYTDEGLLPRHLAAAVRSIWHETAFQPVDLFAISGSAVWATCLFVVLGIAGVCMMLGLFTRASTCVCWVLLISLHNRNELVLNGGDFIFRLLLFWSLWLPLGARASIDAWRAKTVYQGSPDTPHRWNSLANWGLFFVVALPYLVPLLNRDSVWWSGQATYYALTQEAYARPTAKLLAPYRDVLTLLTYVTILLEFCCPLLLLSRWGNGRIRLGAVVTMIGFHVLGLNLFMRLGIFPYVSACSWLAFLPSVAWESLARWIRVPSLLSKSTAKPTLLLPLPTLCQYAVGFCIAYSFLWSFRIIQQLPAPLHTPADVLRIDHRWIMYAPHPPMTDGWFVASGSTTAGQEVDLQTGEALTWSYPQDVGKTYGAQRWRRYLIWLLDERFAFLRERYAEHLAKRWNETNPTAIVGDVDLHFMKTRHAYYARDRISKEQVW